MRGHHFLPGHYLWSLNCVVFTQACQLPNPICVTGNGIHESHCSVQYFVLGYVIIDESDYRVLLFLLQSMKCASMCFTHHLSSELEASDWRMQKVKITLFNANSGDKSWSSTLFAELISVSHRPLGSPLSSLSSSSWSVVQVLLAGEKMMSAHAFLVFLGHLIFWMGIFKVFRCNGLEILIPKHMWKNIIEPLEQI